MFLVPLRWLFDDSGDWLYGPRPWWDGPRRQWGLDYWNAHGEVPVKPSAKK